MLGRRSGQRGMFAADTVDLAHVGAESVYAFFARQHQRLFRDEDFAALYRAGGRPSVPPSLLAIGLLLQRLHGLSDQAFIDATKFDLRFKVALQLEHHDQLCAKSTLQAFRAGLVIHGLDEFVHRRTVEIAKQQGLVDASGVGIDLTANAVHYLAGIHYDAFQWAYAAASGRRYRGLRECAWTGHAAVHAVTVACVGGGASTTLPYLPT